MIQNKKKVGFAHKNLENWHILLSGEVHEINRLCKFTVTNRNMYFETNHKAKGSCFVHWCRPYWEYFDTGVANRTPSPFQACDGVQLQINIENMSTGVLLDQFY